MRIVGKYKIYFFRKKSEPPTSFAFLACFAVSANKFYIYQQNTYIDNLCLFCNVKTSKTSGKLPGNGRNEHRSNSFQWCPLPCPLLYCFLLLLHESGTRRAFY